MNGQIFCCSKCGFLCSDQNLFIVTAEILNEKVFLFNKFLESEDKKEALTYFNIVLYRYDIKDAPLNNDAKKLAKEKLKRLGIDENVFRTELK